MILCDIHNPTGSRRTFFDGLNSNKPISVDPGETKTGVKLAEHVVAILKRAIRPDLKITEREPVKAPAAAPTPKIIPLDAQVATIPDDITQLGTVTAPRRGRPPKHTLGG